MNNSLFIPLLGLLGLLSTFITSKGTLYDKRFKWWRRITKRGWSVAVLALLITVISIWQYVKIKEEEEKSRIETKENERISDSTITAQIRIGVDSNRQALFNDLSIALGRQNLRFDTLNKQLFSIRDSARKVVNNFSQPDPVIQINASGARVEIDSSGFYKTSIIISSLDAGSTNFNFKVYVMPVLEGGVNNQIFTLKFLNTSMKLAKDMSYPLYLYMPAPYEYLDVVMKGTFTTLDGLKKYNLFDVYRYFPSNNRIVFVTNETRDAILKKMELVN